MKLALVSHSCVLVTYLVRVKRMFTLPCLHVATSKRASLLQLYSISRKHIVTYYPASRTNVCLGFISILGFYEGGHCLWEIWCACLFRIVFSHRHIWVASAWKSSSSTTTTTTTVADAVAAAIFGSIMAANGRNGKWIAIYFTLNGLFPTSLKWSSYCRHLNGTEMAHSSFSHTETQQGQLRSISGRLDCHLSSMCGTTSWHMTTQVLLWSLKALSV